MPLEIGHDRDEVARFGGDEGPQVQDSANLHWGTPSIRRGSTVWILFPVPAFTARPS